MKLIPFSPQDLRPNEALPFGVRDASGHLLLAAGQVIASAEQLAALQAQKLFADDLESSEWRRRLALAMDQALLQNASLKEIAAARPADERRVPRAVAQQPLTEQWEDLAAQLDAALRDARAGSDWLARVAGVRAAARQIAERRLDISLYYLIYKAGHTTERYCAGHSLLVMLICDQAAALLGWAAAAADALADAALTMNVAMVRLQDQLAQTDLRPTQSMRADIDSHAERGAQLLNEAGVTDALLLTAVRHHHDAGDAGIALAELDPGRRLARLLRRVDMFSAMMSRRRARTPMSPVQAAKEACLGADGRPDEIGAALLKAVGLYPPGSFVELSSGEVGVVISRGRRANLPLVASLVAPSGAPMGEPVLRDTVEQRYAVKGAVPLVRVKVRPPHLKVMALV